ncbi:MAG: glycosyltransferase [Planctomycetes bacterium]|nr:glycosyltransferase [Planctomycetota bacterium]
MNEAMQGSPPPRSSDGKHWLCIAYAFPPINRSGTHRTLGFVRHLASKGWDATVISVEPGTEPVDDSLCARVPASTTVIRTPWIDLISSIKESLRIGAGSRTPPHGDDRGPSPVAAKRNAFSLREWITQLLITPDSRLGWIGPAVRAGLKSIRRRRPDVIYSTSPYMSAHLIAWILSHRTRVPWVVDFRDPWRDNPFRRLPYRSLERWDAWLEGCVLHRASHIVCNTPATTDRLCRRVPCVARKCTTILNGFDAELFEGLAPVRCAGANGFVMTHCGQFYGPRSPSVWFLALRRLLDESPRLARRIRFVLIGPETFEGRSLSDLAAKAGVAELVRVEGRLGHAETLARMAGSDALVLAGSTGAGSELQVPHKLFEYLAVKKPILAAVSARSPVVGILEEAHAVACVCDPDDDAAISRAIGTLASGTRMTPMGAWSGVDKFERGRRADQLVAIFHRISGARPCYQGYILAAETSPAADITRPRSTPTAVTLGGRQS